MTMPPEVWLGGQVAGTWMTIPAAEGFVMDVRPLRV